MFRLDLHQLTDPGTGGHQKTDDEIPEVVVFCFQVPLERLTVFVCDNGVLEGVAGNFYRMESKTGEVGIEFRLFFLQEKKKMIYGVDPLIDRCGAVIGNQKTPVFPEKRFGWNGLDGQKLPDRPSIRVSGIFRHILFS